MASSVSQLNNYSNFSLFSFDNADLLAKGMLMKQGAIDQNRANLDEIGKKVANFNIEKDIDKAYLEERLVQTKDIVNKYSAGDLSNPNLMNQLVSKFEAVVDDRVLNAIGATSIRTRENKEWEEEEGTEGYNEDNRRFASQNWDAYLANPEVGAVYNGGGGFIKYENNDAKLMSKESQDILKSMGINAKYVKREDGTGYFDYINTYEGTTDPKRLAQAVTAIIGENGFKQMQIDAWARYDNSDNPEVVGLVREQYNSTIESNIDRLMDDRKQLTKLLSSEKNPANKEQFQNQLDITNEQLEDFNSKADFDKRVLNPDGTINKGEYRNAYTSLYRTEELGRLTEIQYQKPLLVDMKVDDSKLELAKFQENQRHHTVMENFRGQEIALKTKEGQRDPNQLVNPNDTELGVAQQIDGTGDFDLYAQIRQEQNDVLAGVESLVGGRFDRESTLNLMEQLNGKSIGDLKEVTINGKKIKITDQNRGQVLPILDRFKKTMVDGSSLIRQTRQKLGETLDVVTGKVVEHYGKHRGDHEAMFEGDNFYFEKAQNGSYIYKKGLMPGAKKSNYKLLAYRASKNGMESLSKAEQMALKAYVVKGVINDDGLGMNDWEKQQLHASYQEELRNTLGAKVVNSMGGYNAGSSEKSMFSGFGGDMIGGNEVELNSDRYGTPQWLKQDQKFSGFGRTDGKLNNGKGLGEELKGRFSTATTIAREERDRQSKGITVRPVNIVNGSTTMANLEAKFSVTLKGKNPQLVPEVADNKQTGRWQIFYEQTEGTGQNKVTSKKPAIDMNGNPMYVTEQEVGMKVGNFTGSVYNSELGSRAGVIELGSSNSGGEYTQGDVRAKAIDKVQVEYLQKLAGSGERLQFVNQYIDLYNKGGINFEVSAPEKSQPYYLMMQVGKNKIALKNYDKKILSETQDIPFIYQNAEVLTQTAFLEYLESQLK